LPTLRPGVHILGSYILNLGIDKKNMTYKTVHLDVILQESKS